jgi:hypothetical protein
VDEFLECRTRSHFTSPNKAAGQGTLPICISAINTEPPAHYELLAPAARKKFHASRSWDATYVALWDGSRKRDANLA